MAVTAAITKSTTASVRASLTDSKRDVSGYLFATALLLCLLTALFVLTILMWDVIASAIPVFDKRGASFLTSDLASSPDRAGSVRASGDR